MSIFKYNQLEKFYNKIKSLGDTVLFKDFKGEKSFLIRHDVDFDLQLALDLAIFENKLGIKSTYFILTTCESYNVLCEKNKKILQEIISLGHEIGLHFDPTLYESDLSKVVQKECSILTLATGIDVKSISLHNPSVHGQYPMFKGFVNAYDIKLFSDNNYISDSRFDFRGKEPFEFIENIENNMIQILLHPLHFSNEGWGYDDIVYLSFKRHIESILSNFMMNSTFKSHISKTKIELIKR